eukprot:6222-Heterococcus_DN1.PRE.6
MTHRHICGVVEVLDNNRVQAPPTAHQLLIVAPVEEYNSAMNIANMRPTSVAYTCMHVEALQTWPKPYLFTLYRQCMTCGCNTAHVALADISLRKPSFCTASQQCMITTDITLVSSNSCKR